MSHTHSAQQRPRAQGVGAQEARPPVLFASSAGSDPAGGRGCGRSGGPDRGRAPLLLLLQLPAARDAQRRRARLRARDDVLRGHLDKHGVARDAAVVAVPAFVPNAGQGLATMSGRSGVVASQKGRRATVWTCAERSLRVNAAARREGSL